MIAVVTGAGVRVGKAIALALAEVGYELALHANANAASAEAVADTIRARGGVAQVFVADLEHDARELGERLAATYPRVDLLVNSAAIFDKVAFEQIDVAAYRRMQAIDTEAPFFLTQALLGSLRAAQGSVVNLLDIAIDRVLPGYAHYTAAKGALQALTRTLAVELAPAVRVNGIAPGIAIFPDAWSEETRRQVLARIPLQRSGTPEDIAHAVLFLARAPYVTGQVIAVDGGWSIHL